MITSLKLVRRLAEDGVPYWKLFLADENFESTAEEHEGNEEFGFHDIILSDPLMGKALEEALGLAQTTEPTLPYAFVEALAEIARHHRDFERIRSLVSEYEQEHPHGRGLCRDIRNIIG